MGNYLRIARVYLCRTTIAVWCLTFCCLLFYSAVGEDLARRDGASLLGGVLSRKSYMAMFAYFNACLLGGLLRANIAQPSATVLPQFRQKHLLVTMFMALLFLAIPMLSMELVGTSDIAPSSVAVIFLTCLAAGMWTLHHPLTGLLAFPFLIFVFARSSSSPQLAAFLAGTNTAVSAALTILSLLALGYLVRRLLAFHEEQLEYVVAQLWGDLLLGRGQLSQRLGTAHSNYLAAMSTEQRATLKTFDSLNKPFSNLTQVDDLCGYCERSLWQRAQLWGLGTSPTRTWASVGYLILLSLMFTLLSLLVNPVLGTEQPARDVVVIMAVGVMTNPISIWIFWLGRLPRLGQESLRPRTRPEFVRELGLTLLQDMSLQWLGGVLFIAIAAAMWAPELLQVDQLPLFIIGTGAGQLMVFAAMGICLLKLMKRGMVASAVFAICPFLALEIWTLSVVMNTSLGGEVRIAIAFVLAAASFAIIALARRRWCRADLD